MKITIFLPKSDFTKEQLKKISSYGELVLTDTRKEIPIEKLIVLAKGSEVIAPDPDNFGGFEKAKERLTKLMESLSKLRGVALSTTSFGWIDLSYCKKRHISVSNIPSYSKEAVAEQTLAYLLGTAKKIFLTDRRTQKDAYKIELASELKDKTLGIIGIGNIGTRVAELGRAIGMKVIAYNRSPKKVPGVVMKSFQDVLKESDFISIHTTHEPANENLIGHKELSLVKKGVVFVNVSDRTIVNEEVMAKAIKTSKVGGYTFEADNLKTGPLAKLENVFAFKGFGWYTKESLERLMQILTDSIIAHIKGKPINKVN